MLFVALCVPNFVANKPRLTKLAYSKKTKNTDGSKFADQRMADVSHILRGLWSASISSQFTLKLCVACSSRTTSGKITT